MADSGDSEGVTNFLVLSHVVHRHPQLLELFGDERCRALRDVRMRHQGRCSVCLRRRVDRDSGFCFRWYVTNPEQRQPSPFGEEVVLDNCVGKLPRRELALYFYILFFACSMDRLAAGPEDAAETRRDSWTRVRAGVAP